MGPGIARTSTTRTQTAPGRKVAPGAPPALEATAAGVAGSGPRLGRAGGGGRPVHRAARARVYTAEVSLPVPPSSSTSAVGADLRRDQAAVLAERRAARTRHLQLAFRVVVLGLLLPVAALAGTFKVWGWATDPAGGLAQGRRERAEQLLVEARPALTACLRQAVPREPDLLGGAILRVSVPPLSRPSVQAFAASRRASPELEACVEGVLSGLAWPGFDVEHQFHVDLSGRGLPGTRTPRAAVEYGLSAARAHLAGCLARPGLEHLRGQPLAMTFALTLNAAGKLERDPVLLVDGVDAESASRCLADTLRLIPFPPSDLGTADLEVRLELGADEIPGPDDPRWSPHTAERLTRVDMAEAAQRLQRRAVECGRAAGAHGVLRYTALLDPLGHYLDVQRGDHDDTARPAAPCVEQAIAEVRFPASRAAWSGRWHLLLGTSAADAVGLEPLSSSLAPTPDP